MARIEILGSRCSRSNKSAGNRQVLRQNLHPVTVFFEGRELKESPIRSINLSNPFRLAVNVAY